MSQSGRINQITKHQKIHAVLCCPDCNSDLQYPNAYKVCDVPFFGRVACARCGPVGVIASGKVVFGADDIEVSSCRPGNLVGALEENHVDIDADMLEPRH